MSVGVRGMRFLKPYMESCRLVSRIAKMMIAETEAAFASASADFVSLDSISGRL